MDNLVRRKKGEDLIFQNMEEKALLQKQALQEERAEELYRKMGMAGISPQWSFRWWMTARNCQRSWIS